MPSNTRSAPEPATHVEDLYAAYVFDLDGTIYLGDDLLPGARRLIHALRDRDLPVRFLSNNPTRDPHQYAEKLGRLGLPTPIEEIVNTVVTMTRWLSDNHPDAVVFPIAEQPLINALDAAGIAMSDDPTEIDIVIASYDRTFEYRKLQIAFDAIWVHKRAFLVATNPDRYCPLPGGRGQPDCASIIAAIEACTGATVRANVGKPDPAMLHLAVRGLQVAAEDCVMVGDRLSTDVRLAHNAGTVSALVLTGDSRREDLAGLGSHERPHFVLERIDRVLPHSIWKELGWDNRGG